MDDDPGSRALAYGPRAVDEPAARVTQDRVTGTGALALTQADAGEETPNTGGGGGTATGATTPVKLPSPFPPKLDAKLQEVKAPHPLRAAVDVVAATKVFKGMALGLADLSTSGQRLYAGSRDKEQRFIASTAKLAIMFAAFQLRKVMREAGDLITDKKLTKDTQFFDAVMKQWRPTIRRHFHNTKDSENSYPSLAEIFEATPRAAGGWDVKFATRTRDGTGRGFKDRLMFTITYSENDDAASCVRDLGFPYLNGCIAEAGLRKQGRGLWLSGGYGVTAWWPETIKEVGTLAGATARSLVELMTLLELDELVPGSRDDMFAIMGGVHAGKLIPSAISYATIGVQKAVPVADHATLELHSKVGYTGADSHCDTAIVQHAATPDPVRYTVAYLNGHEAENTKDAARAMDIALVASRKPPPP